MIRRGTAILGLLALAACEVHQSAPTSDHEVRVEPAGRNVFRTAPEPQDPVVRRVTKFRSEPDVEDPDELLVIERRRRGMGARPRGAELWAKTPERTMPLPLRHTDVKARIALHIGAVTVTQQYHNPYDSKIEAVYVFPLPEDAAIREFVMQIGERRIRGIIREREEARQVYLEARRRGHVASLLTQERPNVFTQAVANIEPGKRIDIAITYFHAMRWQDGGFEFAFPMVVGPRYNPAGSVDGVGAAPAGRPGASGQKTEVPYLPPDVLSTHDIALEVDLDAGLPLEAIESPTHVVDIRRPSPAKAVVTLGRNDRIPNKDFVLRWRLGGRGVRTAVALHRDEAGATFALLLVPPAELAEIPPVPREMIFVLDCSGSMDGYPIAAAKRALAKCLQRLGPDDSFQVLRFSVNASGLGPAPVPATPENVRRGLRYIEGLQGEGGTEMLTGIRAALDTPHAPGRYRIVSFLTDGLIGNEDQVLSEVRRRLGPARIFSFGVGSAVNRHMIEGLARVGRGTATYVLDDDASRAAADALYARIERPALTDLAVEGAVEVHPSPLPDLFAGQPVVITGRLAGDGPAALRVRGSLGGKPWDVDVPLSEAAAHPALGAVWARAKIASLHERMAVSASDAQECAPAIRATALAHGLLSEYTAFVAVDSLSRTEGSFGTTVVQPVPAPKGVPYETTVEKNK
jgi:Ca-activated chloride channel family protein